MTVKLNPAYLAFLIIMTLGIYSCTERNGRESREKNDVSREDLVRANQFLAGKDMELIKAYVSRRNWEMEYTGTGLGYQIYEYGTGDKVERGGTVTIEYTVSLLDGTLCYSSDEDGLKTFRVGQGGVEAGLEEGVMMLRDGDRARFILPPFLAHGLIGDQNRIPPRAVLIYEVKVVNIISR